MVAWGRMSSDESAPELRFLFAALLEVVPTPGCTLLSGKPVGAFARCYVSASSEDRALAAIEHELEAEHLRVADVLWCVREDASDWERPDSARAEECIRGARATGRVIIGRLDTWDADA